jgi:hypothetical protein
MCNKDTMTVNPMGEPCVLDTSQNNILACLWQSELLRQPLYE